MKLVFKTLLLLLQIIQNNHLHLELVILNDWINELVNLRKYDPIDNIYNQIFIQYYLNYPLLMLMQRVAYRKDYSYLMLLKRQVNYQFVMIIGKQTIDKKEEERRTK